MVLYCGIEFAEKIWRAVKKFPVSQELTAKLLQPALDPLLQPVEAWHKYLGLVPGPNTYLYALMAIEEVLDRKDLFQIVPPENPMQFINKGGLRFLLSVFMYLLENFAATLTSLYCFRYLFRSLSLLAIAVAARGNEAADKGHFGSPEEKDKLVSEVLSLVAMYQEANDPASLPLSDPKFNKYWCKVARTGLEFLGDFATTDPAVLAMLRKEARILSLFKNGTLAIGFTHSLYTMHKERTVAEDDERDNHGLRGAAREEAYEPGLLSVRPGPAALRHAVDSRIGQGPSSRVLRIPLQDYQQGLSPIRNPRRATPWSWKIWPQRRRPTNFPFWSPSSKNTRANAYPGSWSSLTRSC